MSLLENAHDLNLEGNIFIQNNQNNGARAGIERIEEFTLKQAFRDSSDREIPRCFEGTRIAHREQIMGWAKGQWKSKKARVMWMDGPAGVGKSAVAQKWADEMGKLLLSAAFFFSRANGWNQAIKLFPTIAYQLATKYDSYRAALDKAITRDPLVLEKSLDVQFEALIVQPILESSLEDQNAMVDTVIVIDGLDECGNLSETLDSFETQVAIINVMTTYAANSNSPFLWGVFSRPETHILNAFQEKPALDITWRFTLPLKAPNADEDIKAYLQSAFETIRRRYPSIPPSWPTEESLTQVVGQADGLFIYVTSAVRYIEQNTGGSRLGPEERLQVLLKAGEGDRARLSKLDRLYLLIMDQIPEEILPSTLLILVFGPLLPVMSSLLGFSQPVFDDAKSPLQSVLRDFHIRKYPTLRFFHTSFTDFLTDSTRSQARYHILTNEICTQFYSACVDVLHRPLPLVLERHPLYSDFVSQEEKEIVVRQAVFNTLFDLPSRVDHYFRLPEHPDILEKMTQIDWNTQARAYESYPVPSPSYLLQKIPWNWRSQIIRPRNVLYKAIGTTFGLTLGEEFVLGHGDKKALLNYYYGLKPYQ
ncbi:hypothetical protein NP233_g2864 [Leucocoprinus birnbaumii]|uniref:Nephrocystin 3-like N-terminal domain-containing protein n=1 Tax=Leucocoprinus birnbaumii TaxID=56174 RepID=A0AAD5VY34_9AGAR|nr:hypothetical protein NP233_g2864 [Leucocoprinus birnbaumii]